MKKILGSLLLLCLIGCSSVRVPNYIRDQYPYKRTFYAPFDQVHATVAETFQESGWVIEKESEPSLFERQRGPENDRKQILLFTKIRQTSFFVGSRYARMNAYLWETADKETEMEIRYLTVTSILLKSFNSYRNDKAVEDIFKRIDEGL